MRLKIYPEDSIRCIPDYKENIFVDVSYEHYEAISLTMHDQCGYVEIRKKERQLKIFQFAKKSYKKECDFGWWEDAEVIFSHNPNGKDKTP